VKPLIVALGGTHSPVEPDLRFEDFFDGRLMSVSA
jgi:hypothetical protein